MVIGVWWSRCVAQERVRLSGLGSPLRGLVTGEGVEKWNLVSGQLSSRCCTRACMASVFVPWVAGCHTRDCSRGQPVAVKLGRLDVKLPSGTAYEQSDESGPKGI